MKIFRKITIILLLAAMQYSCDKKEEKPAEEQSGHGHEEGNEHEEGEEKSVTLTKAQYDLAGIETGSIETRNLSNVVVANGVIDIPPQNLVSISAPMGGFLRKSELLQGVKVKKGQVVAVIENPDFIQIQQDYLETVSKLEYAEQEFERQTTLGQDQINARKVLQQATAEVQTQKARLAGLRERIKTAGLNLAAVEKGTISNTATIVSPISGSVTEVNVNLGKYVNPSDVMFEIVDTDHLHVELSVFEQDIPKLKLGQLVRFRVSNNPGKERQAKVYLINQKINADRTVRVHCHLEHDDSDLMPRNFVKATIETGASPLPALPDAAIVDFGEKSFVFMLLKNEKGEATFEMREVAKGVSENGYTEIKTQEPFDDQAKIVIKGAYTLLAKMKNSEEEGHGH